ncbi:MAG: HAD hydrolase-like protein [Calothrix sp. SM1_5_4]|nr:HAD hydrolase-like protein [Calothrix sp. SM1_5_4]
MNALHAHLENKTHVIWDWNGTLLSDIEHAVKTVNRLLKEENLPLITVGSYKKVFGFPVSKYYETLGFDTTPSAFLALCERFNQYFYEDLITACDLWPGARETLRMVKRSGKTQSLLSASEHGMLLESVRRFQVEDLFDHVFGIHDKTAASKVERGRELMARAGSNPNQTVLVGDTDHDLEVADHLGIDVILVEHGHQCPTRLRAIHSAVIKVF